MAASLRMRAAPQLELRRARAGSSPRGSAHHADRRLEAAESRRYVRLVLTSTVGAGAGMSLTTINVQPKSRAAAPSAHSHTSYLVDVFVCSLAHECELAAEICGRLHIGRCTCTASFSRNVSGRSCACESSSVVSLTRYEFHL